MTDVSGTWGYTYDAANRLTALSGPNGSTSYGYDNANRRTSLSASTVTGSWTYSYDAGNRLTSTTNPYSETTSTTFDAANRATSVTAGNNTVTSYSYDTANRVTSITHSTSGSSVLGQYQYTYDAVNNVLTRTDPDGTVTSFGYDQSDQLTSEVRDNSHSTGYSLSYAYDHNQNRTSKTYNGTTTSYTYDSHDKILTAGSKSYSYDNNGNCTSVTVGSNVTSLTYDIENRVTGISYPGGSSNSFSYNGDDLRTQKVDSTGTHNYLTDGSAPASPVISDGSAVYTAGLSEHRGGASKFYHADALGSTRGITDSTQSATDSILYDAFGNTVSRTGTTPTPFGFVGKGQYQSDSDSGLQLLGHRYYDPSIGRFISSDPAKDGTNWYAYCGNNPVTHSDPTGLFLPILVAILVVALLVDNEQPAGPGHSGKLPPITPPVLVGATGGVLAAPYIASAIEAEAACYTTVEVGAQVGGAGGEAVTIGRSAASGGGVSGGSESLQNCFVAGTPIQLADGTTKPIEQINSGDNVLSKDQFDQAKFSQGKLCGVKASKVVRTFVHEHSKTLTLHFDNGQAVTTTPGHPFYTEGKGWVCAGQLAIGNKIVTRAGPNVTITHITQGSKTTVYNFEVGNTHTYFVGNDRGGLWVHNVSVVGPFSDFDTARRAAFAHFTDLAPEDWISKDPIDDFDDGGTQVVFHGPNGEKIAYDSPHKDMKVSEGHDKPHIGVQDGGKRYSGAGARFNYTYDGPQGPRRR